MGRSIEMFLAFEVTPKQSARMRWVGKQVKVHRDERVAQNHAILAALAAPHVPPEPLTGGVEIWLNFWYPFLKKHTAKQRASGMIPKTTAPDIDNLQKQVFDVMQKQGFVTNDAQFAIVHAEKWHTHTAGVQIKMQEID